MQNTKSHILIFEPRTQGHHLSWLCNISRIFLKAGFKVSLATDYRGKSKKKIQEHLPEIIDKVSIFSTFEKNGKWYKGSKIKCLSACFHKSRAQEVFMNNLDEIMSHCLRLSAAGINMPENLKGRLSGVYFRPRFVQNPLFPPGNMIKSYGFKRLCRQNLFKNIFFMDEYLLEILKKQYPEQLFHFLPDPWQGDFSHDKQKSRKSLGLPDNKLVFLFFGIGDKRKGLHLLVNSMLSLPDTSQAFLLCAGHVPDDSNVINGLEKLKARGMAEVMDRYVSEHEKELCFCASDFVLLPYINHFGSSGVLSLASAAGKTVIASDYGLLGKRVKKHNLGFVFKNGNVNELKKRINNSISLNDNELLTYEKNIYKYSNRCSMKSFESALLSPYN